MSVARRSYHEMARQAFTPAEDLGDAEIAIGVPPVLRMLDALRLQAASGRELMIDSRPDSGLPFFSRVAQVAVDAHKTRGEAGVGLVAESLKTYEDAVRSAEDTMVLDKRMFSPVDEGRMRRAEYTLFLSRMPTIHDGLVTPPLFVNFDGQNTRRWLTWSVWDMNTSCPVRFHMHLDNAISTDGLDETLASLDKITRQYDSLDYPLASVAGAVDEAFPEFGVRKLCRVIYGPLFSHHFMAGEHPVLTVLSNMTAAENEFALEIRKEETEHSGSLATRGFFTKVSNRQFDVDSSRPDTMKAGASRIIRRLIAPHRVAQSLNSASEAAAFVADRRIIAIAADGSLVH